MASISNSKRSAVYLASVAISAASLTFTSWAVSTATAASTSQAAATCENDHNNLRNLAVTRYWYNDGAGECEEGGSAAFVSYIRVAHRAPDGDGKTSWKSAYGYEWIQVTAARGDGGKPGLVGKTVDLVGGGTRKVKAACLVNVGPNTTYIAWPNKNGIGTR